VNGGLKCRTVSKQNIVNQTIKNTKKLLHR
jgi:hypothetical protein